MYVFKIVWINYMLKTFIFVSSYCIVVFMGSLFSISSAPSPTVILEEGIPQNKSRIDTESDKFGQTNTPYQLSHPKFFNDYLDSKYFKASYSSHLVNNLFIGLLAGIFYGGIIGFAGTKNISDGISSQDFQDGSLNSLFLASGILGAIGLLAGTGIFVVEYLYVKKPYSYAAHILRYSSVGLFLGIVLGGMVGLIPLSQNNSNFDVVINSAGYGAGAGLIFGLILFSLFELNGNKIFKKILPEKDVTINFYSTPEQPVIFLAQRSW